MSKKHAMAADSEHPICDHAINALGEAMVHPAAKTKAHQLLIQNLIKVLRSETAQELNDYALLAIRSGNSLLQIPTGPSDGPADQFVSRVATEVWVIGIRRAHGKNRGIGRLLKTLNANGGQIQKPETILGIGSLPRKADALVSIYTTQLRRRLRQRHAMQTANL